MSSLHGGPHEESVSSQNSTEDQISELKSLQDLTIVESFSPGSTVPKHTTFYHITSDEKLYFGQTSRNKKELSLQEFRHALERIPDEEVYPSIPSQPPLTSAPESIDQPTYIKRPGLNSFEDMRGTPFVPKAILQETLIMEQISKTAHPNIIRYYGCRTRRGRICAIVLEELEQTLSQFISTPEIDTLDKTKFADGVESAIEYLHSLGLAHNDLNPDNIMVRRGNNDEIQPVLIDFGSCQPYGKPLDSLGTVGWYDKPFFHSELEHDTFGLAKLRRWLEKPE